MAVTEQEILNDIENDINSQTTPGSILKVSVVSILNKIMQYIGLIDSALQAEISNIPTGPQGEQGIQGPVGPVGPVGPAGLTWQGVWDTDTSYSADDAVGYDGASWFCISPVSGTENPTPDIDPTHWALLASQGAQGETGSQGPTGPQGPPGTSGSSAVYKAILTQTGAAGVSVDILHNSLGITIDIGTQSTGSYSVTPSDFGNYSCHVSNLSPTKTVKCAGYITGFSGVIKQFDLTGDPVANFDDIYIEIRPLSS